MVENQKITRSLLALKSDSFGRAKFRLSFQPKFKKSRFTQESITEREF
jgi:hypothetical protein